jgi:pimeloyl-ACP methyl ester carboxylesterase
LALAECHEMLERRDLIHAGWGDPMHPASAVSRQAVRSRNSVLRRVALALVALGLVGLVVYVVAVAVLASDQLVRAYWSDNCETPMGTYGWPYEAINYDITVDAATSCPIGDRPSGDEVVAPDGTRLAGWFIPAATPDPGRPTLLLVHGHDANKSDMLPIAATLHGRYDLVVMDLRATGYSAGSQQTMGVMEQQDVDAMLDWLVETKDPAHIAAVAVSGGAAAVLAAARDDERIEAVVADSMHARIDTLIAQMVDNAEHFGVSHPRYPGAWAAEVGIWVRTGGLDLATVDPVASLTHLGQRPLLLLHGTADHEDVPGDSAEVVYAEAERLGVTAQLRYCPGAGHAGVVVTCADRYGAWVDDFLRGAFGG